MKLGLCLPGGGAKGAFQAGVIYGLYEKGLDFDVLEGNSIGAINGYYIYTGNVGKLKEMWINIQKINKNGIKIINNTVDNSLAIDLLRKLKDNCKNKKHFYVNYVQIENSQMHEVVVDISKQDYNQGLESIKYSSLLPFRPSKSLSPFEQFKKDLLDGLYNGYKLDRGMINNTLLKPLIDEKVDKIVLITMNKYFEIPDYVKKLYKEDNIIIIKPNIEFSKNDTLNFEGDFCKRMFNEGYDISKSLNIL